MPSNAKRNKNKEGKINKNLLITVLPVLMFAFLIIDDVNKSPFAHLIARGHTRDARCRWVPRWVRGKGFKLRERCDPVIATNLIFKDNVEPDWVGGYILKYITDVRFILVFIILVAAYNAE